MADNRAFDGQQQRGQMSYGKSTESVTPSTQSRRNRDVRQFTKKLLIGMGVTLILLGVLLIGLGIGASVLGSQQAFLGSPFIGGFMTVIAGLLSIYAGFRKGKSILANVIVSAINCVVVGFLVIYSAATALSRDGCPAGLEEAICDNFEAGPRLTIDGMLIATTVAVMIVNIIVFSFSLRMYLGTYSEKPHLVVT